MVLSLQPWLSADLPKDYWNNSPNYHIERSWEDIDKWLSTPIWRVVVDVKKWVATVFVKWETKSHTEALKDWLTLDQLYDREISLIDEKFWLKNLDYFLKSKYRRVFLDSCLKDYWWKLNENDDVIVWNNLMKKWTEGYISIMEKALNDLKIVYKALLIDAKERKSRMILEK